MVSTMRNSSILRVTLIGLSVLASVFLLFVFLKARAMEASQHDVAAQRFLSGLHVKLSEYKSLKGSWPTKDQIGPIVVMDVENGAGVQMTQEQMDSLWAECELMQPLDPSKPIASIPAWRAIKGKPAIHVLIGDGRVFYAEHNK